MTIKERFNAVPNLVKYPIIIGIVIILGIFVVFKGQQTWNHIGNKIFEWKIGKKQEQVNKDLADAAKQKAALEQSYKELAQAVKERDEAKAETDRLKVIFNDSSKTSAAKVAEFKKAVADEPVHTPTDNITTNELCERAKAIGASAATIAAVCGQ
jgi:hypothetical protein